METSSRAGRTALFPASSEMARRMRAFNWAATELRPPEEGPENLRIAVSLCLTSRFPVILWWGPRLSVPYNDACIPFLRPTKHPRMLGRRGRECRGEMWETIGPMLEGVLSTGSARSTSSCRFSSECIIPRLLALMRCISPAVIPALWPGWSGREPAPPSPRSWCTA